MVEFEVAGSKYFARVTGPLLQIRHSADWMQQQGRNHCKYLFFCSEDIVLPGGHKYKASTVAQVVLLCDLNTGTQICFLITDIMNSFICTASVHCG
jgi:hypothetical protein